MGVILEEIKKKQAWNPFSNFYKTKVTEYLVISMSRNGLLLACARFIIEQGEIRKKQNAFKSVNFECRMVLCAAPAKKCILLKNFILFHQVLLGKFQQKHLWISTSIFWVQQCWDFVSLALTFLLWRS